MTDSFPFLPMADLPEAALTHKRTAILPLYPEEVDRLVRWWLSGLQGAMPRAPRLPAGATIVGVGWCESHQCLGIKLQHPDWMPNRELGLIPLLDREE